MGRNFLLTLDPLILPNVLWAPAFNDLRRGVRHVADTASKRLVEMREAGIIEKCQTNRRKEYQ